MISKQEKFIEASNIKHNYKYDYSLVEYTGAHKKVEIVCPAHGSFHQTPSDHVHKKAGCPICAKENRKQTCLEKYGVDHARKSIHVQEKQKQTNLERYGVDNPFKNKEIQEKQKHTMFERYGVEHNSLNPDTVNKRKQTMLDRYGVECGLQVPIIQEKKTHTMLERYGVEHAMQCLEVRQRYNHTCMTKYGHHPRQLDKVKYKQKQTCLEKYGVDNPRKAEVVKNKIKHTMLEKYGVEHALQNQEILDTLKQYYLEKYGVDNPRKSKEHQESSIQTCLEKYGVKRANQKHMVAILPLLESREWLFDQYITQGKTADIIAEELQIMGGVVRRRLKHHEIAIRYTVGFSYRCIQWLNSIMKNENIHIQHAGNADEFKIPSTRWKADGYCKETNTIYEFHGDVWHGNPDVFEPTETCHPYSNLTAGELYYNTLERETQIKNLGYNLIVMWENDFINSTT